MGGARRARRAPGSGAVWAVIVRVWFALSYGCRLAVVRPSVPPGGAAVSLPRGSGLFPGRDGSAGGEMAGDPTAAGGEVRAAPAALLGGRERRLLPRSGIGGQAGGSLFSLFSLLLELGKLLSFFGCNVPLAPFPLSSVYYFSLFCR